MDLTWTAPESDGGAEITNYTLQYRKQGDTKWKKYTPKENDGKIPILTHKVTGLNEDTYYEFRVAAENRAGMGPYSDPSEPAKTPIVGDAPVLEDSLKDVTVVAPEMATFACGLHAGEPAAQISWLKSSKVCVRIEYIDASCRTLTSRILYLFKATCLNMVLIIQNKA